MIKKAKAEFVLLFQTPNPDVSLSVSFWNYGEQGSEPVVFDTKYMSALAAKLMNDGWKAYDSKDTNFKAIVLVRQGIDAGRAIQYAKTFLKDIAIQLAAEFGVSLDGGALKQ